MALNFTVAQYPQTHFEQEHTHLPDLKAASFWAGACGTGILLGPRLLFWPFHSPCDYNPSPVASLCHGVLRAPQRASGASSGKRETTSAPPWAAPRNARRRDAEACGPSRARVPAPTCAWVDSQTEPFEGRGKTKRTSDSADDIGGNLERPGILDESSRRRHELSPPLMKPFNN